MAIAPTLRLAGLGGATVLALAFLSSASPAPQVAEVTIREGTNMAAAISPDGETLAIDALGRIWVLPAEGGTASALTDPVGDARQPVWSPDGGRIAFQAYWDGNYHIWAVSSDGASLEQLTDGPFDHREPHWSADGSRIAFSSDRAGTYDIWELLLTTGVVQRMTDGPDNEYGPAYAPDGSGIWVQGRDGRGIRAVAVAGQVNAPSWSPDGETLAYVKTTRSESTLMVATLGESGEGIPVTDAGEDVFPFRASWGGDGVVYTGDGKIRTRVGPRRTARDLPFEATVTLDRPAYTRRVRDLDAPGPHPVRGIISPAVSPDGESVAFSALGDLWVVPVGARPVRVTDDPWIEIDPAWSPDGSRLAYASDRAGQVDLWVRDVASGEERRITDGGGTLPTWSPDGSRIAFIGGGRSADRVQIVDVETGDARIVRTGLNRAGRPTWSPDGSHLGLSAHQRYSTRFREGVNKVLLIPTERPTADDGAMSASAGAFARAGAFPDVAADGGPSASSPSARFSRPDDRFSRGDDRFSRSDDRFSRPDAPFYRPDARLSPAAPRRQQAPERWLDFVPHGSIGSRTNDGPVWSPDGRWMAYVSTGVLWAIPVTPDGDAAGPPRRLTNEAADDPSWTGDSQSIVYLTAGGLRRVGLRDGDIDEIPVDLTWTRATRSGSVLVRAGALFDGSSDELRQNVDILVDGNRIVAVEDRDPSRTADQVVDATDGVVIPGLIEMHTHGGLASGEQFGRLWLSFGVTSIRMPVSDPFDMVEGREAFASGRRPGPRVFGTGRSIDGSRIYYNGAPALGSLAQVDLALQSAETLGFDMIKAYVRLPDPVQRRVIRDAHAIGIPVTSHELYPGVAYGADGVEHVRGTSRRGYSTKVSALNGSYADVIDLLAVSGMQLTPTVGISGAYGLLAADEPSLLEDPRVDTFFPGAALSVRRFGDLDVTRTLVERIAGTARRVVEAGGTVIVGTDSPIIPQGLSLLAEMEALARYGGMRPADVLRATTSVSAEALGYGDHLGTVQPGKLADLVILSDDPLVDIGAVRSTRTVIKDGQVFEVADLLERP